MISLIVFHVSSILIKLEIYEQIGTKYFEILCKKYASVSFFFLLSVGRKISHASRNCTKFRITSKQPMLEMHGKIYLFILTFRLDSC